MEKFFVKDRQGGISFVFTSKHELNEMLSQTHLCGVNAANNDGMKTNNDSMKLVM